MKVMKYSKTISASPRAVSEIIREQNLSYFQNYDKKIKELKPGLKIKRTFQTKTNRENIPGYTKLVRMDDDCFELLHVTADSEILNTYKMEGDGNTTTLTDSETNTFQKSSREINFSMVSLVYRFFFNRHMKKVFTWIEQACLQKEGAL